MLNLIETCTSSNIIARNTCLQSFLSDSAYLSTYAIGVTALSIACYFISKKL